VEPHGQRGAAQPAGLLPLRRHPAVEDAGARELVAGRRRCAVNGVSFVVLDTPLKLADNYNIANVIEWDSLPARPSSAGGAPPRAGTPVVRLNLHEFVEVVFQNTEQSWHLDGYDFWVVG